MIGVVGPTPRADRVADVIADRTGESVVTGVEAISDRDIDVVVGIEASGATDAARLELDVPVVFVDVGSSLPSTTPQSVGRIVERVLAGTASRRSLSVCSVRVDDSLAPVALFDVALVASEPGQISEFGIEFGDERHRVRADGVVVATAAGSRGYAHAAGGPIVRAETALVVVPIAAFTMDRDRWIVGSEDPVGLTVERDEGPVSLVIDGRVARQIPPGVRIDVHANRRLPVIAND